MSAETGTPATAIETEDFSAPEGYVRISAKIIKRRKDGIPFVVRAAVTNLRQARRVIEAHIAVTEELKLRNSQLVNGNRLLDAAVRSLADDRARVEAWEMQFADERDRVEGFGWAVREQVREQGTTFLVVYAPIAEGEQEFASWRDAMTLKLQLDETMAKAIEEKKVEACNALIAGGMSEAEARATVWPERVLPPIPPSLAGVEE